MAISKAEKAAYDVEIKDIKRDVDQYQKKINETLQKKRKSPPLSGYFNIELATVLMNKIDSLLRINELSVEMLGIKNNRCLEDSRKEFYKLLQLMEETVGADVDRSLKENDDYIRRIDRFSPRDILNLVQRTLRLLQKVRASFGMESKWLWSFVELHARTAVITKNITSFADIAKFRDPRTEFFNERRSLMQLCKETLTEAAKQYRQKYEMADKTARSREDLKRSIDYLSALRKIHVIFGEDAEAVKLKNIIDAARIALESEDKAKDKKEDEKAARQ